MTYKYYLHFSPENSYSRVISSRKYLMPQNLAEDSPNWLKGDIEFYYKHQVLSGTNLKGIKGNI